MRPSFLLAVLAGWLLSAGLANAEPAPADVKVVKNVAYKTGDSLSEYEKERCKLDLYLPAQGTKFPVMVWLHGGGLTGGTKDEGMTPKIAERIARDGVAVASVNYRLSPKATYPAYIDDSAAAFAFVKAHAAENGIDPARVFLAGHSAGGYLAAMVALDERWLKAYQLTPQDMAGVIPVSGQMMTHFTIRAERGITDRNVITADEAAPINHLHEVTPPILILFADKDWPARREENLYFIAALRSMKNKRVQYLQVDDRTHGSICDDIAKPGDPAADAILKFIKDPTATAQVP